MKPKGIDMPKTQLAEPPGSAREVRKTIPTDRIRLLQFITSFGIGGTERQFVMLGKGLDAARFDLRLACLKRTGGFLKEIEERGLPLREYHIRNLYSPRTLLEQIRLASYLRGHAIQIVHTYGFYPNIFAIPAAWLARVPVIVASIRDQGDIWSSRQQRAQKMICRLAHSIAVNAEAVKQRLIEQGYDPEKITVIQNGIDTARFSPAGTGSRIRQELGLSAGAPFVAVICRLHQDKGLMHFLEAAAIVSRELPQVRYVLMGDGPCRADLEREVTRLGLGGKVIFAGFRLDVPDLLSEASLSVLSSLSEGLSNSLLESLAAGVPAVATNVGGNPEIVEHGISGLLVPPADPRALARAMHILLRDPDLAASFGRAGRCRVAERFSRDRMVRRTETLYEGLISRARSHSARSFRTKPLHGPSRFGTR